MNKREIFSQEAQRLWMTVADKEWRDCRNRDAILREWQTLDNALACNPSEKVVEDMYREFVINFYKLLKDDDKK